ncbi:MAG: hypothetical protein PHE60_04740 [Sulfurospirillaceae bacterium]|nr:hypothetical protein [Sulfurospirillaceae bacterium]
MKKLLILIATLTSMYAVPPCEYDAEQVCMYLYKGPLNVEINIINMTQKKVVVQAEARLDKIYRKMENLILEPNQTITIIKKRYNNSSTKPNLIDRKFSFKYIN